MGFRSGAYATVWEVIPKSGTNTELRISISRRNKETNEYEQDFSGYVWCVGGSAAQKAAILKKRDRIRIRDCDVCMKLNEEKGVWYTNYKIFDFDTSPKRTEGQNSPASAPERAQSSRRPADEFTDVYAGKDEEGPTPW